MRLKRAFRFSPSFFLVVEGVWAGRGGGLCGVRSEERSGGGGVEGAEGGGRKSGHFVTVVDSFVCS